jgi:hypothetical protein
MNRHEVGRYRITVSYSRPDNERLLASLASHRR